MVVCVVFDIDDTIYPHKSLQVNYNTIQQDYELYQLIKRIRLPKFVLTNATYDHANVIVNKLGIENLFRKIYSRDNIPFMKPHPECYKSIERDISKILHTKENKYIFFDDLLVNLEEAKERGWTTIWISPQHHETHKYNYVDKGYKDLKDALKDLNF